MFNDHPTSYYIYTLLSTAVHILSGVATQILSID